MTKSLLLKKKESMEERKLVQLENVTVSHDTNVVLESVNFSLGTNEYVFLTGRVGSGKTSLLRMLYADLDTFTGNKSQFGVKFCGNRPSSPAYDMRKATAGTASMFSDFQV